MIVFNSNFTSNSTFLTFGFISIHFMALLGTALRIIVSFVYVLFGASARRLM